MKKLLFILFVLTGVAKAQNADSINYTPMKAQGYDFKSVLIQNNMVLPSDTTNYKCGVVQIGVVIYIGNCTYWTAVAGTGTVIINSSTVDSITYTPTTSCSWKDGTPTCYDYSIFFSYSANSADGARTIYFNSVGDSVGTRDNLHTDIYTDGGLHQRDTLTGAFVLAAGRIDSSWTSADSVWHHDLYMSGAHDSTQLVAGDGEGGSFSGGSGVQSVTGTAVDNTDPYNPVINSTGGGSSDGVGLLHVVAGTKLSQVNDSTIKLSDSVWTNIYDRLSEKLTQATADGLYSALGHTHTFASLTSKPTDLAGYGITIGAGEITNTMLAGSIDLTSKVTGLLPDANISSASTWNAKEPALTAPNSIKRYLNGYKQFVSFNSDSVTEGSTNLYYTTARSALKLNISDTASMLAGYQTAINSKQVALSGTGFIKATGSTISYDNSTYRTSTGTTGDLASFSASNTPSNISAVATGYLLGSQGTSTLPAWLQAATLNTSLTTPLAILGTGTYSDRINLLSTATSGIRLYNTSDTTTNYERGILTWSANELSLSTAKGGTGSNRNIRIAAANRLFVTSGDLISLSASTSMTLTSGSGNTNIQNNNTTFLVATTGGIGVGSGVTTVAASSILDVQSTTKGALLPRMTKTQRDAISSPAQGLTVFVTDNGGYLSWYNSGWFKVSSAAD